MNDLISIIVPVYNVEQYLSKCLDSIINQTYKNLEIILIDDGSKDNSLKICKKYQEKDKRIIVISQENHGLSYTRNKGIDLAHGKYIGFVDSDDIISINMYEYLYKTLIEQNSQIAICNFICFDKNTPIFETKYKSKRMSKIETLKELMIDKKITNHAVDKLYLKKLFNDIKFPIGKKYEDIATIYKIIKKCNQISYLNCNLYGYYQREDSITGEYNKNTTKDFINAINNRYNELKEYDEDINNYLNMNRVNSTLRYFLDIVKFKKISVLKDKEYKSILYNEIKFSKKLFTKEVEIINGKKKNILIKILFLNPYLFYYIMCWYFFLKREVK